MDTKICILGAHLDMAKPSMEDLPDLTRLMAGTR